MATASGANDGEHNVLAEILSTLQKIQHDHAQLAASVDAIGGRVDSLSHASSHARPSSREMDSTIRESPSIDPLQLPKAANGVSSPVPTAPTSMTTDINKVVKNPEPSSPIRRSSVTSRIILTTYPGQSGIDPITMNWGSENPMERGPVVVSRNAHTIRRRNGKLAEFPGLQRLTSVSQQSGHTAVLMQFIMLWR